jgi:linoleoyl-CoA desaturase
MSQATREYLRYKEAPELKEKLYAKVKAYFDETGLARSGGWPFFRKFLFVVSWFFVSYALVLWSTTVLGLVASSVFLGLAVGGIGLCIQHESNHGACTQSQTLNRWLGFSLDFIGGSSYYWRWSHGLHHRFPNIEGLDYDLDIAPVMRLAPWQERKWFHRFQKFYVWFLFTLTVPKWNFIDDYRDIIRGTVGEVAVGRPRGREMFLFCLFKLIFYSWALVIPFLVHGWIAAIFIYWIWSATTGIVLGAIFQLGHLTFEAGTTDYPKDTTSLDDAWITQQLDNTANFTINNRFVNWYAGGLNFQIEHHLFPHISHIHYPKLAGLVQDFCRENGLNYHTYPGFFNALRSHYRNLQALGQAEPVLATA